GSAIAVIVGDHIGQFTVKQPTVWYVAENVFAVELRHPPAAINEAAADGVAIPMTVRCDGIDRRDRTGDAGDGQRVRIGRERYAELTAGLAVCARVAADK